MLQRAFGARFLLRLAPAALAIAIGGCGGPPVVEPLKLDGHVLTVNNRSSSGWTHVEVWLNRSYRVTAASIPAGTRFQVPLDAFVESRGRRFDFQRMQIRGLRLTAKLPDGQPLEIKKQFERSGLSLLGEQ